jgi:mono/diheme cytochrome c family protein
MHKTRAILALTVIAFASMAGSVAAQTAEEPGKALAEKHCARCHAIGQTGDSPFKPAPPFREVVTRYPVESLAEALAEGISVGHHAMPEFTFTPEQIEDLLSYLDTLKP